MTLLCKAVVLEVGVQWVQAHHRRFDFLKICVNMLSKVA